MTEFSLQRMQVFPYDFYFDGNSKITGRDGMYDTPAANAFSLPHIATCPGATPICEAECYVHGLAGSEWDVYQAYLKNYQSLIKALFDSPSSTTEAVKSAFGHYIRQFQDFRWHVSGDVFSWDYAHFIKEVSNLAPGTRQWIYTRSLSYVDPLCDSKSLVVNLSADACNLPAVLSCWRRTRERTRICYLSTDGEIPRELPPGSVVFYKYPDRYKSSDPKLRAQSLRETDYWQDLATDQRKMLCPPDFFGQSEMLRCGPCQRCMVQPDG